MTAVLRCPTALRSLERLSTVSPQVSDNCPECGISVHSSMTAVHRCQTAVWSLECLSTVSRQVSDSCLESGISVHSSLTAVHRCQKAVWSLEYLSTVHRQQTTGVGQLSGVWKVCPQFTDSTPQVSDSCLESGKSVHSQSTGV